MAAVVGTRSDHEVNSVHQGGCSSSLSDPVGTVPPVLHLHTAGRIEPLAQRLAGGAIVPLTGEIMTMPGLPKEPAARRVVVHPDGTITGLMQGE